MRFTVGMYAGHEPKKIYEGKITILGHCVVTVNGQPLPFARDVVNFSTGLTWGYGGAGPAQLAVALVADAFGPKIAKELHWVLKDLTHKKLLTGKPWVLTEHDLHLEFLSYRVDEPNVKTRAAFATIDQFFKKEE